MQRGTMSELSHIRNPALTKKPMVWGSVQPQPTKIF